jgi:acyl carrier protein
MSSDEIEARARSVVIKVASIDEKRAFPAEADLFRDLGVASTAALDLLLSLEEEFNISIPDQQFGEARSLTALTALIQGLL